MEKLNIPKGEYTHSEQKNNFCAQVWFPNGDEVITVNHLSEVAVSNNVAIICEDSLNTYQQCETLPSELLRQRDILLSAFEEINEEGNSLTLSIIENTLIKLMTSETLKQIENGR